MASRIPLQSAKSIASTLRSRRLLFWDFDGVIKDSVGVKTEAFERLFSPFGADVAARVREHHERHGGVSRFEKLPLYLEWAKQECTAAVLTSYCDAFAAAVRQAVIDAQWVPGVREYLARNHQHQPSVIVTGTPQSEIHDIVAALGISDWFGEVHGAPTPKREAIASVLRRMAIQPDQALVIGDSESDHAAAVANGVDFVLRRTPLNRDLQRLHTGLQCKDFLDG